MSPFASSLPHFSQINIEKLVLALYVQPAGFICGSEGGHLYEVHYGLHGTAWKLLARPLYAPPVGRLAPTAAPTAAGGLGGFLGGYLGGLGGYLGLGAAAPSAAPEHAAGGGATDERLLGVQGLGLGHLGPKGDRSGSLWSFSLALTLRHPYPVCACRVVFVLRDKVLEQWLVSVGETEPVCTVFSGVSCVPLSPDTSFLNPISYSCGPLL